MVDVACIILNYNTAQYTIECVESILDNGSSVSYEIVVVDNASSREDRDKLTAYLGGVGSRVRFVQSKINAVVCDSALRIIIGSYTFRTITAAD